ncbi:MAG: hypothetical protein HQ567_02930, partial [Candidatus Nealsonbacteria bacterium]|nr:hypothetical protein [Candidatus Nealsonbacteria bacterium]
DVVPGDVVPGDVVPGDVVPGDVVPGDVVPGDVVPGDVVPGDDVPGDVVPPVPAGPLPMGRFMSADQILLRYDPTLRIWHRVSGKEILYPGQRLIALPTYRDEITFSAGVTAQLLGGTQVELLPPGALQPAGMKVHFGRVLVMPLAEAGKRLGLAVGRRRGVVTLPDPRSIAALEVELIRAPGTDPETVEATAIAYLYAKAGEVTWEEPGMGQPVTVTVGQVLVLNGQPVPVPAVVETAPAWLSGDDTGSLEMGADRLASVTMEKELRPEGVAGDGGQPKGMHLRLIETYHDAHSGRRRENRWLAARSLGYVGDFGPLIVALNDPDHPPVWMDETIEHLRAAVARSPEMATAVRQTLEKQYGDDGTGLFRMLWGYTEQELRSSEAKKLVEGLDHESLAVRTLSFWNLRDIFGLGLQYKPGDTAAKRRTPTQKWRQRLESDEIWEKLPNKSPDAPEGGRRTF